MLETIVDVLTSVSHVMWNVTLISLIPLPFIALLYGCNRNFRNAVKTAIKESF